MPETETTIPPARDLAAELADLQAFFAKRPRLSKPGISVEAGRHRNTLPQVLKGQTNATAALLDSFYPTLAGYGYQPLSNDYLFLP
jgi:hypothetical protein